MNARSKPIEMPEEIELTPMQEDNLTIEQNIMAAFDADPDNIVWDCRVYKLDRQAGNAEDYLFSILPNELDGLLDRLRDTEGSGTYRVRVYRKEGNRNRVFKQFDSRIKAPAKVTPPPPPQSDLAAVVAVIERNNQRMLDAITAALRPAQQIVAPAPVNPFSMITEMATAMGTLMSAIRPAEGASATDLVLKGVELASKLERGSGETSWLDLIRETLQSLPAIVQMTEAQRAAQPGAPVKVIPPTPLAPPAPTIQQPPPAPNAPPDLQQQIRAIILGLIPKAQRQSNPELYAELLADEFGLDAITALISQPGLSEGLPVLVPEVGATLPWFQSLLVHLTEMVNDARAEARNPAPDAPREHGSAVSPSRYPGWAGGGEGDAEDYE